MIVCKFGGTSVQDRAAQRRLVAIVRSRLPRGPVVVVSALAKVSDGLIAALGQALAGDDASSRDALEAIAMRHRELLADTPCPEVVRSAAAGATEETLAALESLRRGIVLLGDASPWVRARFIGAGEILSSRIVAAALEGEGIPTEWCDARTLVRTAGEDPEKDTPVPAEIARLVAAGLTPRAGPGRAVVTQGFIGSDAAGRMTLLGRGGSDYSASLIGAAAGAEEIEIWTDVDGVLTANPRLVPGARRVRLLSFDEASELAYFGARVLHPSTVAPAVERAIPVRVLNARRPEGDGTTIVEKGLPPADGRWVVKAIADKRGIALVHVVSTRMLGAHGFLARIFNVFEAYKTAVDLLATSEVSVSLTVDDERNLPEIAIALSELARVEIERGLAVLCLVGEGMRGRAEIAAEVFRALRATHVRLITQGASAINLSLVIPEAEADAAVRALHEAFFRGSLPSEVFGERFDELESHEARREAPRRSLPGPGAGPGLAELARRHGTPLYVYDLDGIAARAEKLRAHLPPGRAEILYACKANPHPAIVRRLAAAGVGIEAASPGEVARALECGVPADRILLSATNAKPAELGSALARGVRIALGSRSDIRRVGPLAPGGRVLLRLNPGVGDGHHAHVVTGGAHSKFGIPVVELDEALAEARAAGLEVVGVHAHIGSGIADPAPLHAAADVLLDAAARVPSVEIVDFGGGFGVPYRDGDPEIDLAAWRDGITSRLDAFASRTGRRPAAWFEPGRYLVAPCGWLVAEVVGRKDAGGLTFVGLDTGMNHLLRPALYGAYHRIVNLTSPDAPEEWVEIVGNVCETTDVFASNRPLPRADEGNLLAILDVGAYGFAMASRYNLWSLPAEVAVAAGVEADW